VDEENYMVLRSRTEVIDDPDCDYLESGFLSIELNPTVDPAVFDPAIPEGASLTVTELGTAAELAAEVGIQVNLPEGIPDGLIAESAKLCRFPATGPIWNYPLPLGDGEEVEVLPGLNGCYETTRNYHSGLRWHSGGLTYIVQAFWRPSTVEQHVDLARSLLVGQ